MSIFIEQGVEPLNDNLYKKFYGELEENELVPYNNRLYNDALLYGDEITQDEYLKGK